MCIRDRAIPLPGNPGRAFALLGKTAFVDDQGPAALGKMCLRLGSNLPDNAGMIPVGNAQHMVHPLVVAADNNVGHALQVAPRSLVETANVAPCALLNTACRGAEQSGKREKMSFEPLANRANKGGNAVDILRPSYPWQSSKELFKTMACIVSNDNGR